MNKKTISAVVVLLLLVAMFAAVDTSKLKAQVTSLHFTGWGWSGYNIGGTTPSGLGWVSFDSQNTGAGPTSAYRVNFDSSTGEVSGYAWSSTYGWLSFDRAVTGNPPSDDSGSGAIAKRDSNNKIVGWARFISACKNDLWDGSKCTGNGSGNANGASVASGTSTTASTTGLWDGWVSLGKKAADTVDYGLTFDTSTNEVSGYAWGSSNNVGWLWFSPADCVGPQCVIITGNPVSSSCSISPSNSLDLAGGSPVTATWSASATVSGGAGAPYHYLWTGPSGINNSTSRTPSSVDFTTVGSYPASVAISDVNYMSTSTFSCPLTVTNSGGPGGGGGGQCVVPDNATLCPTSDGATGATTLVETGQCPAVASVPPSCVAQCINDGVDQYIVRGTQCVKKSRTVEQ